MVLLSFYALISFLCDQDIRSKSLGLEKVADMQDPCHGRQVRAKKRVRLLGPWALRLS